MKPIKRSWIHENDYTDTIINEALFIAVGQWANGQLAYSILDANGNEDPKHEGSFIQIRYNNKLVMVRI